MEELIEHAIFVFLAQIETARLNLNFEYAQFLEMKGHIGGQYCVDHILSEPFEVLFLDIGQEIVSLLLENVEGLGDVVTFEHALVVVPGGQFVLLIHKESIVEPRVVQVVAHCSNEERQQVHFIQLNLRQEFT